MTKYLMGIDNGGTVAKAAIFSLDGRELAVASSKSETLSSKPGFAEFDPDKLWQATADSVKRVIGDAKIDPNQIACVACTGHGNGIYLVDADGSPIRNAIYSSDSRASSYIETWTAEGVDRAVRPRTMQALWPGQPNALLAWLREHEPESIAKTRWVLMCKDSIRLRLTGEVYAERTDMSGTSLMNVGTGDYDPELLAMFGLAEMQEKLPPLCKSADLCGEVTADAAAETGLIEGTPVAGGLFDIDACGLSTALTDESQLCMILGTWGINQYVSRTPVVNEVFMTSCYCIPDFYLMIEGSATSASNLEWFIEHFFQEEVEAARKQNSSIYDLINQRVAATEPSESGILFFPFLYGSNAAPDASACLVGLSDRHDRGHVLRAIYEGVVFGHMTHFEQLMKVRQMPERIRLSGGATRSDVWVQMIADTFQVPVEVPNGSELGALGAAICASVAIDEYVDYPTACEAMVRFSRVFEPNDKLADLYRAKYARYKRFLEAMQSAWKDLNWPPDPGSADDDSRGCA